MPTDKGNNGKDLEKEVANLKSQIKKLQKTRLGLVFAEKQEEVVIQCKEKIPVLKEVKSKKIKSAESLPNLLIEGDNYHALSVLNYTHKGLIDVIYIDPPYNTGARDWKYNNDYVDSEDPYRHSKWLSFMQKRLVLAKELLKPDGVLIVTIDEHEVHHLGVLLEQLYPEAYRQMVTIVINPKGVTQGRFARVEEYAFFCFFGNASVESIGDDLLSPISNSDKVSDKPRWKGLLRSGTNAMREDRKKLFYPVLVDEKQGRVIGVGAVLPFEEEPDVDKKINGYTAVWPMRTDGTWGNWGVSHTTLLTLIEKGYVSLGTYDKKRNSWSISYLSRTAQDQIAAGLLKIIGHDKERNVVDVRWTGEIPRSIKTVWHRSRHDAGAYGTDHLRKIFGSRPFSFPKSIYSVIDTLSAVIKSKPDAIVLDFFAGSGTTGEAVLRLNKEYSGNRSFILCTNNENKICEEVTYERIKRVIKGYDNGKGEKIAGIPAGLSYYKTDLVDIERLQNTPDHAKVKLTYQAGEMIALRENTLNEVEKNDWWQIFEGNGKITAVYFKEDKEKLQELVNLLEKKKVSTVLYIFSWGKNEYRSEYSSVNIKVEDVPEPILEVYKEINRL